MRNDLFGHVRMQRCSWCTALLYLLPGFRGEWAILRARAPPGMQPFIIILCPVVFGHVAVTCSGRLLWLVVCRLL